MNKINLPLHYRITVILLLALAIRCSGVFAPLAYDEIWTLENFSQLPVSRILTDLALPNNHPLNTLWIKFITSVQWPLTTLRLHSLAAGMAATALTGVISFILFSSRTAALWSTFAAALSAPAILYSQLARGYSLQLAFLLLFATGLATAGEHRPENRKLRYLPEVMQFAGGVCAMLTLPSSAIFLGTATLAAWYISRRLPPRSTMITLGCGAIFSLGYLILNYLSLRSAQQWGETLDSAGKFFDFLLTRSHALFPLALLPLIAVCFRKHRRTAVALAGITAAVLLSALLTRGGPPRVYLPLAIVAAIAAGGGADGIIQSIGKEKWRICAGITAALLITAGYLEKTPLWRETDFHRLFREMAQQPSKTLVICRATTGFPLMWNNRPAIWEDYSRRLYQDLDTLLLVSGNPALNGADSAGSEKEIALPFAGSPSLIGGEKAWKYRLTLKSGALEKGEVLLFTLTPGSPDRRRNFQRILLEYGGFLVLNVWFNISPAGEAWCAAGVITDPAKPLPSRGWPAYGLRFYRISPY